MKKKVLVGVISVLSLVGVLCFSISYLKAEKVAIKYSNCPNGCYEGGHRCFCFTWGNDEEDAKSGGDTEDGDVIDLVVGSFDV